MKRLRCKVVRPYVYIVYECSDNDYVGCCINDGKIHGVYLNKDEAEGKRAKLSRTRAFLGYIAILKKPLQGRDLTYKMGKNL